MEVLGTYLSGLQLSSITKIQYNISAQFNIKNKNKRVKGLLNTSDSHYVVTRGVKYGTGSSNVH